MFHRQTQSQQGVALITALLIVALATIAAVAVVSRQQFDIRRSANLINRDQAYQYALGVESWAIQLLARDRTRSQIDDLTEDWAKQLPPLSVEGGQVAGHIEDLQGRFNLNNLVNSAGIMETNEVARFQRLLQLFSIPPELAFAVVDWLDVDINPNINGGAEDDVYTRLQPAYRTANTFMNSPSELRFVAGFKPEYYTKLEPFICTLPRGTQLNVNTAPAEVLTVLDSALSLSAAQSLVAARTARPFADATTFGNALTAIGGLTQGQVTNITNQGGWTVSSNYFLVTADALFGKGQVHLYSELKRDANGQTSVIYRAQGVL
jgi:general secretion pathway protein K